jgi:hypothetical protein
LDGLLGSDNKYGFKASATGDPSTADQILVLDGTSQTFSSYFYSTFTGYVGWYDSTTFEAAGSSHINPGTGMIFRVVGPAVTLYFSGEVQTSPVESKISHGINLIGVMNPLVGVAATRLLTLDDSGLFKSGADSVITVADGNVNNADWVYRFNSDSQTLSTYFYSTTTGYTGWYDTTSYEANGSETLTAGSGFYLYRRGSSAFSWIQPVNYLSE